MHLFISVFVADFVCKNTDMVLPIRSYITDNFKCARFLRKRQRMFLRMVGEYAPWLVDGSWSEQWLYYKMSRDRKDFTSDIFSQTMTIVNKILYLSALGPYKFINLSKSLD